MEKKAQPVKLLVVSLDNLGDAVMASSVLGPLHKRFPHARIGLFVKEYAAELFTGHSLLHKVHGCDPFWDRAPGRGKGSYEDFKQTLADIRREHYDTALILNAEWRRSLAIMMSKVKRRVGYSRRKSFFFLTKRVSLKNKNDHFVDQHRKLLEGWWKEPVPAPECMPQLEVTPKARHQAQEALREKGWKDKYVLAIHPFSGDPKKNWPVEKWAELAKNLSEAMPNVRFLFICAAGERLGLSVIDKSLAADKYMIQAGASLSDIKAFLFEADLAVGGDSGPGHIAAALGKPVISLFGPTHPDRSRPFSPYPVTVIKKNPLADLTVGEVQNILHEIISHPIVKP